MMIIKSKIFNAVSQKSAFVRTANKLQKVLCQSKVIEIIKNMNKPITSSKTVSFNILVQRFQVQNSWIFQLSGFNHIFQFHFQKFLFQETKGQLRQPMNSH